MSDLMERMVVALERIAAAVEAESAAARFLNDALAVRATAEPSLGATPAADLDWRVDRDGRSLIVKDMGSPASPEGFWRPASPEEAAAINARIRPQERRR